MRTKLQSAAVSSLHHPLLGAACTCRSVADKLSVSLCVLVQTVARVMGIHSRERERERERERAREHRGCVHVQPQR